MIAKSPADFWAAVTPAVCDHLWQSTLVVLAVWLTTLALRRNHARVRYGLWLAASLKFLLPFSLLVTVGSKLAPSWTPSAATAHFYLAADRVSEPCESESPPWRPDISSPASASLDHFLPGAVGAVWLGGFMIVVAAWSVRWRKVFVVIRAATPLTEGREVEALRRIERLAGVRRPLRICSSPTSLEPGVFGIARPVLLWPKGISLHLDDTHLESIVAHEVWHVRRRDNLAAAIHMLVEAVFWFHPLVWWLGARLADERECACDEEVLRLGSEPGIYAESILRTCRFCVGSQLECVSGVTGADLKRRITHIMTQSLPRNLDFNRKVLIAIVGLLVAGTPVMFGVMNASPRGGEATVEVPGRLVRVSQSIQSSQEKPATEAPAATPKPMAHAKKVCSKSANKSKHAAAVSSTPATKP